MIHNLMWLVTAASIVGTVLNIKKKRICFVIWLCTNFAWMLYDYWIGSYAQSALFTIYVGLAIWGILEWQRKAR